MIDKKEAKSAYKLQEKFGAVVAYKNISKNKFYLDIAPDLPGLKNCFEFSKKTGIGVPLAIDKDWKTDDFELLVLEELKKDELQTPQAFKEDLKTLREIWLEKFADKDLY
ncbi:GIY-YIG nuclease family protein [Lactococcus formosensis]|uniref:GIY-YIG nuclease family protein n=1 Tax=Lactococcus formosensis TaxID=1281486 RepID=A0A9X4P0J3_9LACT|nr:GIY-YIG nuclease family protein [Lactococcus formosensis]MDG6112348.1 GIY-YIG nuclease family protein [Lactococcus formosensis]MDG6118613.1 GIY-YIG nuclease family protein [Lactococcus formosensis]MDG6133426.1 GIY-YIG nuclease family protein [Lactococcus formosensis]MDG6135423.1 GIY-YIG nuclease family protein [Lactococcus formosensis]MDG6139595.1 GIY-YIG nuclease family protein [Lactococcus formosensis]